MTLVAGCYERFLFGFRCQAAENGQGAKLVRNFNYPAHKNAVKCLASAGGILASGGADDLIHLYDVQSGRDLGFLMNPGDGAVSTLDFHQPIGSGPSHLLNGSTDGSISVWQAGSWDCLKTMEGHKGTVNSISVHPSGTVALSVGRDRELRVWNLVKGRVTYHSKLAAEADRVAFLPSGEAYALCVGRNVTLHSTEGSGTQLADLPHPTRVLSTAFAGCTMLLTGCEDGSVRLWDSRSSKAALELPRAHSTRVRGIAAISAASSTSGMEEATEAAPMAASASTDGIIRLWDLRAASTTRPLAEEETSARLTCLEYVLPARLAAKQPKQPKLQDSSPASKQEQRGTNSKKAGNKQRNAAEAAEPAKPPGAKARKPAAAKMVAGTAAQSATGRPILRKAAKRTEQSATAAQTVSRKQPAQKATVAQQLDKAAKGSKKQREQPPSEPAGDRGMLKLGVVEFAAEEEGDVLQGIAGVPQQTAAGAKRKKAVQHADGRKNDNRPKAQKRGLDLSRFD